MSIKRKFVGIGILAVAYYYNITLSQKIEGPTVETKLGKVRGIVSFSRGGRKYYEYLGIPFAKPPVGDLRFEPPQPAEKWEGVLDASSYGSKCVQVDLLLAVLGGDEDCLTINVFTPIAKPNKKRLPVMVYIHGGFFHNGGSDFWRPTYFMDEDVLLITFNYRLASLGFLNTGDGVVRGNMGLKDQSLALLWIQQNIKSFGGDPLRVTLLGESAGGACSHLHMFSPMSRGLFRNVISQSGTGLHFWAINKEPEVQAKRFGALLGCPTENSTQMVHCLRQIEASKFAEAHREVIDPLRHEITIFKPTVEVIDDNEAFLTADPYDIVQSGNFMKVSWITGVNSEEGLISSAAIVANKTLLSIAQEEWQEFVRRILWYPDIGSAAEKVRKFYFGETQNMDPIDKLDKYTNMISDRGFFVDTHHGAKLQSKHSPVYLYYYTYVGEWSVANFFMEVRGTLPRLVEVGWAVLSSWVNKSILGRSLPSYGTSHSDELALMFQMPWISDVTHDSKDYQMSVDLVKLWANYAANDKKIAFRGVTWIPVNGTVDTPLKYLKIDTKPSIIEEPFTERVAFWDSLNTQTQIVST